MFVAHMPAGYLMGTAMARRWPQAMTTTAWAALLVGSVAPDIDWLYFYSFSDRSFNHHIYPPHLPIVWFISWAVLALSLWRAPRRWQIAWTMFCMGWLLHLMLDTVAGKIWWLWPWVTTPYVLIEVPRRFASPWLNFLTHPSILIELAITTWALRKWLLKQKITGIKPNKPQWLRVSKVPRVHRGPKRKPDWTSKKMPCRPYRVFL